MKQNPGNTSISSFQVTPIGYVKRSDGHTAIELLHPFKTGLKELEHFSHIQVIWWFSHFDDADSRSTTTFNQMPFEAPELGVFACRSPMRPNPLGLTTAKILRVDHGEGSIVIADIDAYEGTPVLDLKAYLPSCDRVKEVKVADWAAHWPEWLPENGLGLDA